MATVDDRASLRQAVTNLFDAVRYSENAKELEVAAKKAESDLEKDLDRLEGGMEDVTALLSPLKNDHQPIIKEFSRQASDFLATAKEQAKSRLEKKASEKADESRTSASNERSKAIKSLEAFLAEDPLPMEENTVIVKLVDGFYHASSTYQCEGNLRYTFGLAVQNSKLFGQEFNFAQLGYELRIPVRFSRALLKGRVPGFERLDQYTLTEAETSAGRIQATFEKDNTQIKVVTSGGEERGFVGIEYNGQGHQINVMNDPSLSAHVQLDTIRNATQELVKELSELSTKKAALLKLSLDGDEEIKNVDCYKILELVLKVLGPRYRAVLKETKDGPVASEGEFNLGYVRKRLKLLGELGSPVADTLGIRSLT